MDGSVVMGPSTSPDRTRARKVKIKSINLALQGGGAHGAFTWGGLDRLLEDERIRFDGISATSAGAMNAAALAAGMAAGGHEGARKALARLWRRISNAASTSPLRPTLLERLFGNHSMAQSAGLVFFELKTRLFSQYEFNPLNRNPLRQVLLDSIDFDALSPTTCPIKLYLAATNVRTGKIKVFDNSEIGADAVLASACLPFLFQPARHRPRAGRAMARRAFRPHRRRIHCGSPGCLHVTAVGAAQDRLFRRRPGVGQRCQE
jgi:NTE family protein